MYVGVPQRPVEGIEFLEAEITGSCELPNRSAGNQNHKKHIC